ncbi:MAG: hypothetical protein E4H21_10860 [Thermodesulfobacteriales bacterium]|nr:MAG: hypothetical protein E4H21_10860 [Thermodesulfobacteriales bacterium]
MITYQLFWFTDEITRFLELEFYFRSKSGIIMGALNDFTYERVKMEGTERVYLLGFGSNSQKECYKEITIYCSSEEEKLAIHEQVMSSLHELVEKSYGMKGSSYMSWPL